MNIHTINAFFMRRFRPRRARQIAAGFPLLLAPSKTVLDVGGGPWPWSDIRTRAGLTILNRSLPSSLAAVAHATLVTGDGTALLYRDKVFSNTVIEHVGNLAAQRRFAAEVRRCGREYYVQTPNRWFFVEPHLITAFVHWLPFCVKRRLVRHLSVWGLVTRPTQERIDDLLRNTRLLSKAELASLFPGDLIVRERFLGMTKSFIVIGRRPLAVD